MTFDKFLGHVQHRAHLGTEEEAFTATRATLETLAQRVFHGRETVASQLPAELGELMRRVTDSEKFDLDELFARVSQREHRPLPIAVHHARVVAEVLREAIDEGAFEKLLEQLPTDLHVLFDGSAGSLADPIPFTQAAEHRRQKARDVMTRDLEGVLLTSSVHDAARRMRDLGVGSLVVADLQGHVVGIVTDRDLATRVTALGLDADHTRVEDVMSHELVCCFEDDDVQEVARVMEAHHLRRVPIVKPGGPGVARELVGIISVADLPSDLRVE